MNCKYSYWLALAGFLGLFAWLMFENTQLAVSADFPIALKLLITITPLLLPMRGFLAGRRSSCIWMAFISLIYLIQGTIEMYANENQRFFAAIEVILALMLFFGNTYYVRLTARRQP